MATVWLTLFSLTAGFVGLVWSADRFIDGAAATARNLGMPPILIGLTIVSIGTSAPEAIVSANAALADASGLAVGNALGSNLANIGLVLGVTALWSPLPVSHRLIQREVPLMFGVTILAGAVLWNNTIGRWEGTLMLGGLIAFLWYSITSKAHQPHPEEVVDVAHLPVLRPLVAWLWLIIGLAAMLASSHVLVWSAKQIALALGVSDLVIGLTVVAVGTSLPELAATLASARRGHHDLALGNIMGSNVFNLLGVMALPGLIAAPRLEPAVFSRDFTAVLGVTALLLGLVFAKDRWGKRPHRLGRWSGFSLLAMYAAYYVWLFALQST